MASTPNVQKLKGLEPLRGRGRGTDTKVLRVYDQAPMSTSIVPGAPPQPAYVGTDVLGNIGAPQTTSVNDLYGGGTGGGTVGGTGMPGGYVPATYNLAFWNDPEALAQDILSQRGIDNPQLSNLLGPTAQGVNYLTTFLGGDQPGEFLSAGEQAGHVTDLMNQLLTPGGQGLDPGAIMAALANADPNSVAGQLMSTMSPREVGDLAMNLLASAGGNPLMLQGIEAMMQQGGRDYDVGLARGTQAIDRPYWQSLQGGEFGRYFGR